MKENRKCPMCNKKMVMKDGVPTCPDCGFKGGASNAGQYNVYTNSYEDSQGNYSSPTFSGASGAPGGAGQNSTVEQAQRKMRSSAVAVIIASAAAGVLIVIGLIFGLRFFKANSKPEDSKAHTEKHAEKETEKQTQRQTKEQETSHKSPMDEANSSAAADKESPTKVGYRPKSDMMIELAEIIFEKDIDNITREELDSVVYLDIYDLDNGSVAIYFELDDGTSATCFMSSTNVDTTDLICFGGLQCLFLEDESLDYNTDWSSLTDLYILQVDSSVSALTKVMDVSQLYALQLGSDVMSGSNPFEGISAYANLQYLEVNASFLHSIEGISKAPALTELYIEDGDGIDDFEELYNMPQLEALSIESSGLRDIGFVSGMDNLLTLELKNTALKKIDAIADCADTLTSLRLHQNYNLETSGYDVVYSCTNLVDLELYVNYDFNTAMQVPDLSMMTNLNSLTVGNFDMFDNLKNIPWITELTVCDSYTGDPEALAGLTGLTKLTLDNMSVEPGFLEPLAQMQELTMLDMTDSYYWGDPAVFLQAPNLQSLYLDDATIGLNESTMPVCESLTLLSLDGTSFKSLEEDGSWYYDNVPIALADNMYFLSSFPNLQVLYVPEHDIDDLSFTEGMNELYYLDISNNYITDLSPLAGLASLEIVICPDNPIHDRTGMENVILIE